MSFFAPKVTYFWRPDSYAAPEQWRYFQCVAVASIPGTTARVAFGFITTGDPTSGWTPTGLTDAQWARDWHVVPKEDDSSTR
ncbi:hypothetical protein ACH4NF_08850 [Streptomyces sp. NPDC017248]|uniref:hypothetical protein n=1 Tax=unclassified Streptomyces TaxID=2593676 RepID=UPI0037A2F1EC